MPREKLSHAYPKLENFSMMMQNIKKKKIERWAKQTVSDLVKHFIFKNTNK